MDLADKYFTAATSWMPNIDCSIEDVLRHSGPFDYKSIMIYGSKFYRAPGAKGYPLVTTDEDLIHMGGDADPEQAGISDLDIERVVELYPKGSVDSHSAPAESSSTSGESDTMPSGWRSVPRGPPARPVTKRWWSVQENYDPHSIDPQPWPASQDGKHTVAYCFQTQNVFAELGGLFTRALAKWAVAIHASSLEFKPDHECDRLDISPCLCTTHGVADETLHIMQAQQGQPPFSAESTLGYRNPNFPRQIGRPRHFLMWPANTNHFGTPSHGGLTMAHELGSRTHPTTS